MLGSQVAANTLQVLDINVNEIIIFFVFGSFVTRDWVGRARLAVKSAKYEVNLNLLT
jgi:hypothetical protein